MKRYLAIIALSIPTLTVSAWAQQAQQMQRSQGQSDVTDIGEDVPSHEERVEIATADLPQEVMQRLKESEYGNMRLVSAYEVRAETGDATHTMLPMSDTEAEDMTSELETTEEIEKTGEVVAAQAPEVDDEITEAEKEVYERVQYDNYSEANGDGYAEIAQQEENTSGVRYELRLEDDQQATTLTYDATGELLQADSEDM